MTWKLHILTFLLAFGFSIGGECIEGDCINGQGTMTFADGDITYVGGFKDGKFHGQGTFTVPDGDKYMGEWKDNKYHGQGTYIYADGMKYVGEFKDGLYHGWGILTNPDGTSQIGIFFNDNFVEEKTFTEVKKYLKTKYPESDLFKDF